MAKVFRIRRPFKGEFIQAFTSYQNVGRGTMLCYKIDGRLEYVLFQDSNGKEKVINNKLWTVYQQNYGSDLNNYEE